MKIFNYIPGYRSRKVWKIVIATIYYLISLIFIAGDIGLCIFSISIPFIIFGIAELIKRKSAKILISGVIMMIAGFALIGIGDNDTNTSGGNKPAETETINEVTSVPTATPTEQPTEQQTKKPTEKPATPKPAAEPTKEPEVTMDPEEAENDRAEYERSEYLMSCDDTLTYDDIARNPQMYTGKRIMLTGQVQDVLEDGLNVTMLIKVTKVDGMYEHWTDLVYVTYKKKSTDDSRFLEGDIVSAFGVYKGIKSYKTVMDATNQVPYLAAEYIL